ncbi:MAG: galactose mutarotase [Marinilabiliaceae bacterium]|nr:galactose mutarotase [Marinilabiliaceae bacterium]
MTISNKPWGKTNGNNVFLYTLTNKSGLEISITNYGGIITSILMPDKNGQKDEITLGFDSLKDYISEKYTSNCPYFGALIGRYANRIAKGKFSLEGVTYSFICNNGNNHLHGGNKAFHNQVWDSNVINKDGRSILELSIFSNDMEEGYPGNLKTTVLYSLTDDNELIIEYSATTDKTTHVNFTNHAYFNLNGCKSNVENHQLQIFSEKYTEATDEAIPTGKIIDIKGTEMDFFEPHLIGERISKVQGRGYDHNYILKGENGELKPGAIAIDQISGRKLEFFTTEPAVQLYTGNYLDGSLNRGNTVFNERFGFCLEAQHYPNSPNEPSFPSTLLKPGNIYSQTTVYKFSTI